MLHAYASDATAQGTAAATDLFELDWWNEGGMASAPPSTTAARLASRQVNVVRGGLGVTFGVDVWTAVSVQLVPVSAVPVASAGNPDAQRMCASLVAHLLVSVVPWGVAAVRLFACGCV